MQKSKRKKAGKIFRLALVITVFVLITATVLLSVAALFFFRVEKYSVEGISPYTKEEIIAASGITVGKSLIFADLDEGAASIEKKLPYTDDVRLSRKFPNTLVIHYGEHKERYALPLSTSGYALLGGDFKTLSFSAQLPDDVTVILGASPQMPVSGEKVVFSREIVEGTNGEKEEVDKTGEILEEIAELLEENEFKDISAVSVESRSNIYLIYQDRIVLKIGSASELDSKLSLAKKVLSEEESISANQYCVMDLTVPKQAYFSSTEVDKITALTDFLQKYRSDDKADETEQSEESQEKENGGEQ